jgi:hypothetical protein
MRMQLRYWVAAFTVLAALGAASKVYAIPFANSLWIGNDTNPAFPILNTDRTGAVLQTIPGIVGIGFGVDLTNNILYTNETFSGS